MWSTPLGIPGAAKILPFAFALPLVPCPYRIVNTVWRCVDFPDHLLRNPVIGKMQAILAKEVAFVCNQNASFLKVFPDRFALNGS